MNNSESNGQTDKQVVFGPMFAIGEAEAVGHSADYVLMRRHQKSYVGLIVVSKGQDKTDISTLPFSALIP
jgi:hypothetical protein